MLRIIKNMYMEVQIRVACDGKLGPIINSTRGVKQGDNLSPNLFNFYMNDFPEIFDETCDPPSLADDYKVYCLQYADDIVILSESSKGLQSALDMTFNYLQLT